MNYKLVRNQLGEYGILREVDDKLMQAFGSGRSRSEWTKSLYEAEKIKLEYEQLAATDKKRNTWKVVE